MPVLLFVLCSLTLQAQQPRAQVFSCMDGTKPTALSITNTLYLILPDGNQTLYIRPSASGAKYVNAQTSFWFKGDTALLSRRGEMSTSCVLDRDATTWELAKLDGADFRAFGDAGEWDLLFYRGGKGIIFAFDNGVTSYAFANGAFVEGMAGEPTQITASSGAHTILVTLTPGPCRQSDEDRAYESTVSITLDGVTTFEGCGNSLR